MIGNHHESWRLGLSWPPDDLADPGESWARPRQVCKYCKHGSYLLINPTHTAREAVLAQDLDSGLGLSRSPLSHSREFYTEQVPVALYSWCGGGAVTVSAAWWDCCMARYNPLPSTEPSLCIHTAEIMSAKINFVIPAAEKRARGYNTYCTDMGIVIQL